MTRNIQENNWSVAWLSVPTTFIVSLLACVWHLMAMVDSNDTDYRLAGILFCFACTMEGIAEPAVLEALRRMDVTTKASAEGLATVTKTLATLVALKFLQDDWPVTAFGVAQLCYATIYSLVLWRSAWTKVDRSHLFGPHDGKTCKMVVVFALQGFFKHLLTEGDKLVLTMLTGDYDQGVYAMGSAYGVWQQEYCCSRLKRMLDSCGADWHRHRMLQLLNFKHRIQT
jgi:oligosaccharide translocation protein RFT1